MTLKGGGQTDRWELGSCDERRGRRQEGRRTGGRERERIDVSNGSSINLKAKHLKLLKHFNSLMSSDMQNLISRHL